MQKEARFEIITIGNELLFGSILDTNANWLCTEISKLGGFISRTTTIRDDVNEIASTVRESLDRGVDWILISGGLGPTYDDRTLEGVSKALRRPLTLNRQALGWLKKRNNVLVGKRLTDKVGLTPARLKMVTLPKGAVALRNPVGSAPGVMLKEKDAIIICMPGVPSEMKSIFTISVLHLVKKTVGQRSISETNIIVSGLAESSLAPIIDRILSNHPFLYIISHPMSIEDGVSKIRIHTRINSRSTQQAEKRIREIKNEIIQEISARNGLIEEL